MLSLAFANHAQAESRQDWKTRLFPWWFVFQGKFHFLRSSGPSAFDFGVAEIVKSFNLSVNSRKS